MGRCEFPPFQFVTFSTIEVKVMRWYHHCFSFDYESGEFALALDGRVLSEGKHPKNLGALEREIFFC